MRQALSRRYARIKKGEAPLPDLLLIDGGPGQLTEAIGVLEELEIEGVCIAGVAKGADRRPGQERLFLAGESTRASSPPDSPALHLIQRIRDEAHRFAITGHRQRRAKARTHSVLETVPGLGPANVGNSCDSSAVCKVSCAPVSTTWRKCTASAASSRSRSTTHCTRRAEIPYNRCQ